MPPARGGLAGAGDTREGFNGGGSYRARRLLMSLERRRRLSLAADAGRLAQEHAGTVHRPGQLAA